MREKNKKIHARLSKIIGSAIKIAAAAAFVLTATLNMTLPVSAAKQINETISLANARKNRKRRRLFWDNINDTLTLNGLNIDTTDDYGLKLPDNATHGARRQQQDNRVQVALLTTGTTILRAAR